MDSQKSMIELRSEHKAELTRSLDKIKNAKCVVADLLSAMNRKSAEIDQLQARQMDRVREIAEELGIDTATEQWQLDTSKLAFIHVI